ncbi:hypothetical protein CAEBREN_06423 [Caenorhabditis brenneri]|uniref:Uncharacterized protein n=1 Tax=Caenorhabditis brenneri TaxID=135651 RepID=G0NT85_CAEBE|nr:hypothetical protein CAEBREN_06423 [Caenorhabditis brenneri]
MTSKAEIAGYGKGIAANILIATAVTLREEYCFSFSKIFAEEPIPDIKNEFEKSYWIGTAFMLPVFRERMVQRTIKEFGLDKADIGENVQKLFYWEFGSESVRNSSSMKRYIEFLSNGGTIAQGISKKFIRLNQMSY